jgi:hypothetical protein
MNMPGFNAENSTHKTISHFQSKADRTFGSGKNDNQVYMQKPRSQNIPGGACHATTAGGSIKTGTYDSNGDCCGPKLSNGSQYCINCDNSNNTCDDGHASSIHTHPDWPDILGYYSIDTQPGRVGTPFMSANRIGLRF